MNQKAQKYITSKKETFLIKQGLCEKVFAPNPEQFGINHTEYPYSERSEKDGSTVYYKLVPIELTDEEFEQVYSAFKAVEDELGKEDSEDSAKHTNGIAIFMTVVAVVIYIVGLVVGIVIGNSLGGYHFSWTSASICWFAGFVYGSLFLGVSEVIKLLHRQCD
jgi:hypothetical protein